MASRLILLSLLSGLLFACATHQVTQKPLSATPNTSFNTLQVQVDFATPAHTDYLSSQLVKQLAKYGVEATPLPREDQAKEVRGSGSGLLHVTLTGTWTETFISRRTKHRRSLTQTRGRIPRESPRFRSDVVLVNLQTNETVWQSETTTAGAWYSNFNDMARSLAARLTRQLKQDGLIGSESDTAPKPAAS